MKDRTDRILAYSVLVIAIVQMALMSCFSPYQFDDLGFMGLYLEHSGFRPEYDLDAWAGYITELRQNDNSRLSNLLMPFFTVLSPGRQIFPLLAGLAWAFVVYAIVRLAGAWKGHHSFVATAFVWSLLMLTLPWRDNMFLVDYIMNYVFSAALTLGLVLLLTSLGEHRRWWYTALTVIVAVLAGAWHEGFAVSTLCGLGAYAVLRRFRLSVRFYAVVGVYAVVTAAVMLCPGLVNRFFNEISSTSTPSVIRYLADLGIVLVMCALSVAMACNSMNRNTLREVVAEPTFMIFFTACIVGCAMSLTMQHTPRTAFWPDMCAVILLLMLLYRLSVVRRHIKVVSCCVTAMLLFTIFVCSSALVWQYRLNAESKDIMALFGPRGENRVVFYDVIPAEDIPLYTLKYPSVSAWITKFSSVCLDRYFASPGHVVVPTDLRDIANSKLVYQGKGYSLMRSGSSLWLDIDDVAATDCRLTTDDSSVCWGFSTVRLTDGTELRPPFTAFLCFGRTPGRSRWYVAIPGVNALDVSGLSLPGGYY